MKCYPEGVEGVLVTHWGAEQGGQVKVNSMYIVSEITPSY